MGGTRKYDTKNIARVAMAGMGSNGRKQGVLRNHCDKAMGEVKSDDKDGEEVFKKPKTPKKAGEKKVGIS